MRERNTPAVDDRQQRQALEQLQAELKATRAALSTASAEADRTAAALLTALEEAKTRRDAAAARVAALKKERASIQPQLNALEDRVEEKRKEDEVLARGAQLRNVYVDWNPGDRQEAVGDGLTVTEVKWAASLIGFLFLTMLAFGFCK